MDRRHFLRNTSALAIATGGAYVVPRVAVAEAGVLLSSEVVLPSTFISELATAVVNDMHDWAFSESASAPPIASAAAGAAAAAEVKITITGEVDVPGLFFDPDITMKVFSDGKITVKVTGRPQETFNVPDFLIPDNMTPVNQDIGTLMAGPLQAAAVNAIVGKLIVAWIVEGGKSVLKALFGG